MKASEYIKRLQELMEESGSDPEVVSWNGPVHAPDLTATNAELMKCKAVSGGFFYAWDGNYDSVVINTD